MAFLKSAEYDIFISYSHVDNQPDRENETGWVDCFERQLSIKLLKRFGEPVEIWWDRKLRRAQLFDKAIEKAVLGSTVLVALITNRYLKSDYCRQEIEWFCGNLRQENAGMVGEDYQRLFPVMLYNIPRQQWPKPCFGTLAFPFHDAGADEHGEPLRPDSDDFQKQLRILVEELYEVLTRLKMTESQRFNAGAEPGDTITAAVPVAAPVAAGWANGGMANPASCESAAAGSVPEFTAVQEMFTRFVGPMAGLLAKKHAPEAGNSASLAKLLSAHIPDMKEKAEFLRLCGVEEKALPPAGRGQVSMAFGQDVLARVETDLSFYVGPIARALVADAAKRATTLPALYHSLAQHIPLPHERQGFLSAMPKFD